MERKILAIPIVIVVIGMVLAGLHLFPAAPSEEKPKVAVVSVEGTIDNFGTSHKIAELAEDPSVEAVVLEVDSSGGYVSPSFQLEETISRLSEEKPVFAAVEHRGLSGAYLAVSAADNLYVHHSSLVGSVGVIAIWTSLENYYRQEGIEHHVFKTAPHKDMFAPWRGPTENERAMIQNQLHSIEARMVSTIENNRGALEDNVPPSVLSGEAVRGFRAVDLGLADAIVLANQEVVERAADAAGLEGEEYRVVELGSSGRGR